MSETCFHNCASCSEGCDDREQECLLERPHVLSHIKKIIGIVSGKGGVGKSLITSLLAVMTRRLGYSTAILDADITGPSIPRLFGLRGLTSSREYGLFPVETDAGIRVMSLNLLVKHETDPAIWRGPLIADMVTQFWTDVIWGDVDYMFIDMPPGTGDVPLTVFQSIPIDGVIVVASPQELVGMIVEKAANMAAMMKIPVLAMVENMSYIKCPDCGREIRIFGESHIEGIARKHNIKTAAKLPLEPTLASACDEGKIEQFEGDWLKDVLESIIKCDTGRGHMAK